MLKTSGWYPPGGLLFGAGQAAEEQQLVDVEQRLREVAQQEAPAGAGGAHVPAPHRREGHALFQPRRVRIHRPHLPV